MYPKLRAAPSAEGPSDPANSSHNSDMDTPPSYMDEANTFPDLVINSLNDLVAMYLFIHSINRSLLYLPTSAILHAVTPLSKYSTNDTTLDIVDMNVPSHLPEGFTVQ